MNPFNPVLPGWGLHQELALLRESGLTPMQALQTATRNPARYFGILDETGTIEAGKSADLVLLDADPLADIQNTQKIDAVVSRGRYYSRAGSGCDAGAHGGALGYGSLVSAANPRSAPPAPGNCKTLVHHPCR